MLSQIAEICFLSEAASKSKKLGEDEKENSELPLLTNPETNIYSFGVLLLEIISGKLPFSEEQGHLVGWVSIPLPFIVCSLGSISVVQSFLKTFG